MKLQILGSGCAKCARLADHAGAAARELGLDYTLEKITDVNAIIEAGVLRTPALAVDGTVRLEGRVPPVDELKTLFGAEHA